MISDLMRDVLNAVNPLGNCVFCRTESLSIILDAFGIFFCTSYLLGTH